MSQLLVSVVRCMVGRIEGVSALVMNERVGGDAVGLDEEVEVDVAVVLSAVVRRRVPGRCLALEL